MSREFKPARPGYEVRVITTVVIFGLNGLTGRVLNIICLQLEGNGVKNLFLTQIGIITEEKWMKM